MKDAIKAAVGLAKSRGNTPVEMEKMEEAVENTRAARLEAASKERNRADKISSFLNNAHYLYDVRPTHVIPRKELEKYTQAQLEALPMTWYFSRYYQALNVITDLFPTQKEYDEAEVEKRRAWCAEHGIKYAALGPKNRTLDLAPQLGLAK